MNNVRMHKTYSDSHSFKLRHFAIPKQNKVMNETELITVISMRICTVADPDIPLGGGGGGT